MDAPQPGLRRGHTNTSPPDPSSRLRRGERRQTGGKQRGGWPGKAARDALPTVRPSLCPPVEDGPDASTVRAVPVHVEPGG